MTTYSALITGSTSGIGKAFTHQMAQQGHHLILVSKSAEKLQKQKEELEQNFHITVETIAHDLSEPDAAEKVFAILKEKNALVDLLINNAGFGAGGDFIEIDFEKNAQMIHLHILFTTQFTKLLLPQMLEKGFGRILNLGSVAAFMPLPYMSVYAACKAYVLSFSKALRYELKNTGVSVTCLCPGATKTEFAQKSNMEGSLLFNHLVMSPEQVAEQGYKAMMNQKKMLIPGFFNKLIAILSTLSPDWLNNKIFSLMAK